MVIEEEANIAAADRKKTCAIINPLIPSKNGAAKQDNIIVVKAAKITTPDFFTRSSKKPATIPKGIPNNPNNPE